MRAVIAGLFLVALAGCADMNSLLYGESIYYLDAQPTNNNCRNEDCRRLDRYQNTLYASARSGHIKWVQLVDLYYARRDELFPTSSDTKFTSEIRAYQKVLAEQMDMRRITESQWVYLQQKRVGELQSRDALIQNTQPRNRTCNTINVGTPAFPNYQTQCR